MVVEQAQPVVAPDHRRAACRAARGHARSAFARLLGFALFGEEPVRGGARGGEGSEGEMGGGCEGRMIGFGGVAG